MTKPTNGARGPFACSNGCCGFRPTFPGNTAGWPLGRRPNRARKRQAGDRTSTRGRSAGRSDIAEAPGPPRKFSAHRTTRRGRRRDASHLNFGADAIPYARGAARLSRRRRRRGAPHLPVASAVSRPRVERGMVARGSVVAGPPHRPCRDVRPPIPIAFVVSRLRPGGRHLTSIAVHVSRPRENGSRPVHY